MTNDTNEPILAQQPQENEVIEAQDAVLAEEPGVPETPYNPEVDGQREDLQLPAENDVNRPESVVFSGVDPASLPQAQAPKGVEISPEDISVHRNAETGEELEKLTPESDEIDDEATTNAPTFRNAETGLPIE